MAKPAYRVPYDLKVTGEYRFITPTGSHKLRLVGHEAQSSTSQMLYQGMDNDDAEVKAVIVNNSAIKRMADGKTVTAISSKGLKGKLKRLKDAFKSGGKIYADLSRRKPDIINEQIELFDLKKANKESRKQSIPEIDIVIKRDKKFASYPKITSSATAVEVFRLFWDSERIEVQELLYVALLNRQNKVTSIYYHSKGAIGSTTLDVEIISAVAVKSLATGVIIAHNHPSGTLEFSKADEKVSGKLKSALKLFDIDLLDSLVITKDKYISMMDEGISFKYGGSVDANWVKDGDDFIHESGYTVALHLDKDEEDYDGSTYDERQYVVLDNDGFDVAGEYMPLKQAKQTVLDALEDEDEDDYKTGGKIETKAQNKFIKVMREFGKGTLPHGKTGKIVTDRNVALAIAFSEARDIDPYFQKKKNTIYKFKNKHGGISTVKVTRNVSGKNIVNATEKGKKDSKTGFAKIYKTINSIQTEDETKDMEATINALKPIIRYF